MSNLKQLNYIFLFFLIIVFLIGLYVTMYYGSPSTQENMEGADECPDFLVKEGNILMLYNTKKPQGPKNPIPFFNLDEYINYVEIQKRKGKNCPVLYLQEEVNTQGKSVMRIRPNPFDQEGGLPTDFTTNANVVNETDASRDNPPYNQNMYPSFDPLNMFIGEYTNLDAVHDMTGKNKISDNPMDSNWAGITYTNQMVDSGKYAKREITKPTLFNPKVVHYKDIKHPEGPPKDFL